MADIFVRSLLTDTILLEPKEIGSNYIDVLHRKLNDTIAGKCSRHGLIEPNSISVRRVTQAEVVASALNGSVQFSVQYHANVCNPPIGAVIPARAVNRNKFGIQAHSGILYENGDFLPVIQSIVTTTAITKASEVDVNDIEVGQEFLIEVLTKQFHLGSPRIMVIGRIVTDPTPQQPIGVAAAAAMSAFSIPGAVAAAAAAASTMLDEDDTLNDDIDSEDGDQSDDGDTNAGDRTKSVILSDEDLGDDDALDSDIEDDIGGEEDVDDDEY